MLPEKRIELVHLQLTRNCNLRCWFCGQWGKRGFFSNASGSEMSFEDWKKVINSLIRYREETKISPSVMLWGGEPLMSPDFQRIVEYLRENNFELGMVTNGVLLDKYIDLCKEAFKKIYISIDGNREIHDGIRGDGVFDKVSENIKLLQGGKAEIIIMTVISPEVLDILPQLPDILAPLKPDKMLLQEMIYMSQDEIKAYSRWLKSSFGMNAKEIYSWEMKLSEDFQQRKEEALRKVSQLKYSFPVAYLPHGEKAAQKHCLSPFRHIHVAWNGDVMYCTDFYDFSVGNVKEEDVISIFNNEMSEKFRSEIAEGNCSTCNHCAWRNNKYFAFKSGNIPLSGAKLNF